MSDFVMPSLGADMEFGTLLEWRVHPGDAVERGDIVACVDTDKAEIEVEIFEDGVIDELLVGPGTRVAVGTALARVKPLAAVGARAPAPAVPSPAAVPPPLAVPPPPPVRSPPAVQSVNGAPAGAPNRLRVSPLARRAAQRLGVDLGAIAGSGQSGAIVIADVERAAAAKPAASATAERAAPAPTEAREGPRGTGAPHAAAAATDRQAAMRAAIGALMARSKREIPHYYLEQQIDISAALQWLAEANLSRAVDRRLLPSVLLLRAVVRAAERMPEMNGHWINGELQRASAVHLGVAISLRGGGLIAPALQNSGAMSLDELMAGLHDLVTRARAGRLRGSEMSDPTITVTNLGARGADLVHGVIYPPQVALVGFGAVRERPWAAGGMLGVRPAVTATLAADHRASDGHAGSRFLELIERQLHNPEEL